MFSDCSEISITVIVKHVQHIGIVSAFCPPNVHPSNFPRALFPPHQLAIFMSSISSFHVMSYIIFF